MKKEDLQLFISKVIHDNPDNILKAFLVVKPSATKMYSYQPEVSNEVQQDITSLLLPRIGSMLNTGMLVDYNPVGVADEEIEKLSKDSIEQSDIFFESISDEKVFKDLSTLRIGNIGFYCFELSYDSKTIYLFRQFAKMKKLRKGYLAQFFDNELKAMDGNFLGIDEAVDIIISDEDVYLINHVSLERIFNYRDQYLSKTNEAMGEILRQGIIDNLEQFSDDCCRDVRIMKRFTNIMTQGRLFFDNYDRVPEIVHELGLDIEFSDDGKMIYREKSQLYHIVNLLSDSYFKSLLAKRIGVVKTEGALE